MFAIIYLRLLSNAPVAQLDRVTGYEPVGRGFESLLAHQKSARLLMSLVDFLRVYMWKYPLSSTERRKNLNKRKPLDL